MRSACCHDAASAPAAAHPGEKCTRSSFVAGVAVASRLGGYWILEPLLKQDASRRQQEGGPSESGPPRPQIHIMPIRRCCQCRLGANRLPVKGDLSRAAWVVPSLKLLPQSQCRRRRRSDAQQPTRRRSDPSGPCSLCGRVAVRVAQCEPSLSSVLQSALPDRSRRGSQRPNAII